MKDSSPSIMVTRNHNQSVKIYGKGLVMLERRCYHPKASYLR
jgi:hypothetical protein